MGYKRNGNQHVKKSGRPKTKENAGKKNEIVAVKQEIVGVEMPKPEEWMLDKQQSGEKFLAKKIYEDISAWVCSHGCQGKINQDILQQYAMNRARWIQCQQAISKYGFISKHPTTHEPIASPYVKILTDLEKCMNNTYYLIEDTIKKNCVDAFTDFGNDIGEFLD